MWTQVQEMRQNPVIAVKGEAVAGAEELQPWDPITYYIPSFTVAFAFFLIGQMASTLLIEKGRGHLPPPAVLAYAAGLDHRAARCWPT